MSLDEQVYRAADLVAYQEDAVVSRTIIDQPMGTVTLFAFDAGQGLSEHTASYDALVYLLEVDAEIVIAGQPYLVERGELLLMPADKPHALTARTRFKMLLVMVRS